MKKFFSVMVKVMACVGALYCLAVAYMVVVTLGVVASHAHTTKSEEILIEGNRVPGMSSGYSCDMGELGTQGSYEQNKKFWGDDGISRGFAGASDAGQMSIWKMESVVR